MIMNIVVDSKLEWLIDCIKSSAPSATVGGKWNTTIFFAIGEIGETIGIAPCNDPIDTREQRFDLAMRLAMAILHENAGAIAIVLEAWMIRVPCCSQEQRKELIEAADRGELDDREDKSETLMLLAIGPEDMAVLYAPIDRSNPDNPLLGEWSDVSDGTGANGFAPEFIAVIQEALMGVNDDE